MPKKTNGIEIDTSYPPVVREYDIGGIKFIVTSTTKPGATESAVDIVRRLILKEISQLNDKIN